MECVCYHLGERHTFLSKIREEILIGMKLQ